MVTESVRNSEARYNLSESPGRTGLQYDRSSGRQAPGRLHGRDQPPWPSRHLFVHEQDAFHGRNSKPHPSTLGMG